MRLILLLALGLLTCSADSLTGTLYSDHRGPSANASVTVELASRGKIYQIYSGARMLSQFKQEECSHIGAIWTVQYRRDPDASLVMTRADCTGKVDPLIHGAWLLVRDYLRARTQTAEPLTTQPQSSKPQSVAVIQGIDFSGYLLSGRDGRCVDAVRVAGGRVDLQTTADCVLSSQGGPVTIQFKVIKNRTSATFEIDEVRRIP